MSRSSWKVLSGWPRPGKAPVPGPVGAGISLLGLKSRPTDLARLQAVAAVGQGHLIPAYDRGWIGKGRLRVIPG